jgi:hypothetical protein
MNKNKSINNKKYIRQGGQVVEGVVQPRQTNGDMVAGRREVVEIVVDWMVVVDR